MSTKAIREVIARLEDATKETQPDAWAEVEAIERAAKEACRGSVTHRLSASDEGVELAMLLESIAEDAP